jgi:HSP20 family protein
MPKTFEPQMEIARIQSEINRLFDNLLDLDRDGPRGSSWMPNADILEDEQQVVVEIELPGVPADQLSVSVQSGNIVIEGVKVRPDLVAEAAVQTAERTYGSFRRMIQLGVPVNTRQASAVLKAGLLRICFPKVPNRRGEAVPIEVHSA